jgi:hypothetical protein
LRVESSVAFGSGATGPAKVKYPFLNRCATPLSVSKRHQLRKRLRVELALRVKRQSAIGLRPGRGARPRVGSGHHAGAHNSAEMTLRLLRLHARAMLDDPEPSLALAEEAAAEGDESWEQWLDEFERGEALIVRLEVSLEYLTTKRHTLTVANSGVWIEKHPDPPNVEQQIAEVASKDFPFFVSRLNASGHPIDAARIDDVYIHVELSEDVQHALIAENVARARIRS